jgi:hypothetical protein
MRPGISITLTAADRSRLEAIVGNRNAPQKHAWRARIVLLSADGFGTFEIMRRTGKSKTCVWRWQERFAEEGVEGLPVRNDGIGHPTLFERLLRDSKWRTSTRPEEQRLVSICRDSQSDNSHRLLERSASRQE